MCSLCGREKVLLTMAIPQRCVNATNCGRSVKQSRAGDLAKLRAACDVLRKLGERQTAVMVNEVIGEHYYQGDEYLDRLREAAEQVFGP